MERDADTELIEVVAEPTFGMTPHVTRYRCNGGVGPDAKIVTCPEREPRTGLAGAAATATDFSMREADAAVQEETARRLRIVIRVQGDVAGAQRGAVFPDRLEAHVVVNAAVGEGE